MSRRWNIQLIQIVGLFTILLWTSISLSQNQQKLIDLDPECTQEKIDAFSSQVRCEESQNISGCENYVKLSHAGSFILLASLAPGQEESRKRQFIHLKRVLEKRGVNLGSVNPKEVDNVQHILRDLEIKRQKMDQDLKEFSKVYAEELGKKKQATGDYPRIRGGKDATIKAYYDTIKDEVTRRIPNNTFTQNFNKGAKLPSELIQGELEDVVIQKYPGKGNSAIRPSIRNYIMMQRDRYDYRFKTRLARQLPDLNFRNNSMAHESLIAEELQSYREYRRFVKGLDPQKTYYGQVEQRRALPVCAQASKMSAMKAAVGAGASVFASWAIGATQNLSIAKALSNCVNHFGIKVSSEDLAELSSGAYLKSGIINGADCTNITFDSSYLAGLENQKNAGIRNFICQMYDERQNKNSFKEKYNGGINWDCDGSIELPNSVSRMNGQTFAIAAPSGSTITLELNAVNEWSYETIKSDDPQLQEYFNSKVRNPLVSRSAKKQVLSSDFVCRDSGAVANDLCAVARHLEAHNMVQNFCKL